MGKGYYKEGSDYPIIIVNKGTRVSVKLYAKDEDDKPAIGLKFLFGFISDKNISNVLWLPDTVGDGLFETANGLIQLSSLEMFPKGYLRLIAFTGNGFLAAEGLCPFSIKKGSNLTFGCKRTPYTRSQSVADSESTAEGRWTQGGTVTGSYAPGGIGGSASYTASKSGPEKTTGKTSTTQTSKPVAGSGFILEQIE